jgi:putative phosphoribosyl transferase
MREDHSIKLGLNRAALAESHCEKHLVVVPGITRLFEEPCALEAVVDLIGDWFAPYLGKVPA